jgi:plastocyanin
MRVKRFVSAGAVAIAVAVGLAGCGGGGSGSGSTLGGATVVAKDSPKPHFEPSTIKAPLNSEVSFTLKNEGKVTHNFTLSFLDVSQDVAPGQSVQVRFTVKRPPTGLSYYTFYDKNYQGDGMQGRVNVT